MGLPVSSVHCLGQCGLSKKRAGDGRAFASCATVFYVKCQNFSMFGIELVVRVSRGRADLHSVLSCSLRVAFLLIPQHSNKRTDGATSFTAHFIEDGRNLYTFYSTGQTFKIKSHITCETSNVIYMIQCTKCNLQPSERPNVVLKTVLMNIGNQS